MIILHQRFQQTSYIQMEITMMEINMCLWPPQNTKNTKSLIIKFIITESNIKT